MHKVHFVNFSPSETAGRIIWGDLLSLQRHPGASSNTSLICSQRSNHIRRLPQASVTLKADSGPFSTPLHPAVETSGPLLRSSSSCFVSVVVFKIPLSEKQNPTMTKSRLLQQIKTRRRKNPSAHCLGSSLHCWTNPPSHCCSAKIRLPYCIKHRRDSSQQLLLNTVCDVPPQTSKLILFCKASVMHS